MAAASNPVVDPLNEKELFASLSTPKIPKEMLKLASHILDTKAGHFDPSRFKDQFEIELRKLVKRKAAGKPIEYEAPAERPSNVIDLLEALRQSVKGRGKGSPTPRSAPPSKRLAKVRRGPHRKSKTRRAA